MAATDALPVPRKNAAYRVYFPILDADGDLVTAAAALDSERSIDGATFADCTNEATEIATSSGMYFLDLTAAEMNGDCICVIVKTSSGKTTPIVLYPEEAGDIRTNVTTWLGTAVTTSSTSAKPEVDAFSISDDTTAANNCELAFDTTGFGFTGCTMPTVTTVNGFAAGAIDATAIATGAIDADALASDAVTEIRSLVNGTADSGSASTMVDAVRTEGDTDYWKGKWILFTSGTIANQVRLITGFTPATDTITFAPDTTQAVSTNTYEILPAGAMDMRLWLGTAPNALVSGAVDADVSAMQANAINAAAIATDAIGAAELATDAVNEIRDAILSDSTPFAGANVDAAISTRATPAQVGTELVTIGLDHLLSASVAGTDVVDNSIVARLAASGATADWDTFDQTTDSLQAIRARGDVAWITGSGTGLTALASGTCQAGSTASTIVLAAGETFADDEPIGNAIKITGGTGNGQSRVVIDYTGSTDTATITPDWTTTPDGTSTYEMVEGSANVTAWKGAAAEDQITALAFLQQMFTTDTTLTITDAIAGSVVREISNYAGPKFRENTFQAGSTTTSLVLDSGASATNNEYRTGWILITNGVAAGQFRQITAYNGATKAATVLAINTSAPASGDKFIIFARHRTNVGMWKAVVPNDLVSNRIDASVGAMAAGTITTAAFTTGAIDATVIAADAIGASELATDAVNEIRDSILSDSTSFAGANIDAAITTRATPTQVGTELTTIGLDHLLSASVTGTDIADDSIVAQLASKSATADWDSFDNTTDSLEALRDNQSAGQGLSALSTGTAQAGGASTITLAAGESATNDLLTGLRIGLISGTGAGQSRIIIDYDGTTKVATIAPAWTTTPDATTVYECQAADAAVGWWRGAQPNILVGGAVDVDVSAMQSGVVTAAVIAADAIDDDAIASGAIAASAFAAGAINATAIAADAIGASELATDAVNEIRDAILSDSTPFAGANIDAAITTRATPTQVGTELTTIGLDHLVSTSVTGTDIADDSIVAQLASKSATADWDSFDNTTDSLEALRDNQGVGSGLSSLSSGTAQAGATGSITLAAGESAIDNTLDGLRIALISGTGAGQSRIVTSYNGTTKVATIAPNWVTNPDATTVYECQAADSAVGMWLGLQPNALQSGRVDSYVGALASLVITSGSIATDAITNVKIATDAIGSAELATSAINEIRDSILADATTFNGADIAAILTDTGTTLDTKLNDIQGATFSTSTDSLEAIRDRGDAEWITGAGTGLTPLASGTAQAGTASTIQLAAGHTFADDELNGNVVKILSGTGAGQTRVITDYTGATDTADVAPNWITNPDVTSVYEVVDGTFNVAALSGDATAADNLEAMLDGTGAVLSLTQLSIQATGATIAVDIDSDTGDAVEITSASAGSTVDLINSNVAGIVIRKNRTGDATGDIEQWRDTGGVRLHVDESGILDGSSNFGTDIAAILVDTAEIGVAGAGLSNITWNTSWDAEVQSECNDALVALQLDHLINLAATGAEVSDNSIIARLVSKSVTAGFGSYNNTTDSLEAIRDNHPTNFVDLSVTATTGLVKVADASITAAKFGAGAIDAAAIAANAIGASELATDAVTEIRNAITGGAYSLSTDTSGRVRHVVGTAAGELNSSSGKVPATVATADAAWVDGSGRIDVGSWLGTAVTLGGTNAKPQVDVVALNDDAESLLDLQATAKTIVRATVDGGTFSPTTTAFESDTAGLDGTDDHYIGRLVIFTSGALVDQMTDITDYDGTNNRFTVTALTEAPGDNDTFVIA